MGGVKKIKSGVVRHIFNCQLDRERSLGQHLKRVENIFLKRAKEQLFIATDDLLTPQRKRM